MLQAKCLTEVLLIQSKFHPVRFIVSVAYNPVDAVLL